MSADRTRLVIEWDENLDATVTAEGRIRRSDVRLIGHAILRASSNVDGYVPAGEWADVIAAAIAQRARDEIEHTAEKVRLAVAYEESHPVECSCGARFRTEAGRAQHKRRSRVCAYLTVAERRARHA